MRSSILPLAILGILLSSAPTGLAVSALSGSFGTTITAAGGGAPSGQPADIRLGYLTPGSTPSSLASSPNVEQSGSPVQSGPSKTVNVGSLPAVSATSTSAGRTGPARIDKPSIGSVVASPSSGSKQVGLPHGSVVSSFTGMTNALDYSMTGSHWVPADTTIATGPNHVMELVNVVGGIWTKQGTSVEQFSQHDFYVVTATDDLGDPRVIYDPLSSRWFATVADFTSGGVYVGVSYTSDPSGDWFITNPFYPSSGYCPDQPSIGVSNDKVVVTVDVYGPSCSSESTWEGFQYWVMNKVELMAEGSFSYCNHSVDQIAFMLYPAQPYSSTNTLYMVSVNDSAASEAIVWTLSGVPTSTACNTYDYTYAPVSLTHYPPNAPQQGSSYLIDTGDSRVTDAFWNQGKLWAAFNDRCVPSGDSSNRACLRIIEIDTTTSSTLQDFDVGVSGEYLYYPALRMNSQGNLVVVFSFSSSSEYPGVGVTNQPKGVPSNTYIAPGVLVSGTGFEAPGSYACTSTACRFGDYSGASTDPSSASSIWVGAEYGTSGGWATYIGNLDPGSPQGVAPLTASYSVVGGGTAYSAPSLTYTLAGEQYTDTLSTSPARYYADVGSQWAATTVLPGSTSSERWYSSSNTNGTVSAAATVAIAYDHQFYLDAVGVSGVAQWANSGATLALNVPEVSGRSNGVGERITSMSLDNGSPQTFPITAGTVPLSVLMNSAHTAVFTSVKQYQVSLDASAVSALGSVTPPTIAGDNYWYDSGTQVSVTLNGVWGRASGTGSRLASYSVNGGAPTATGTTSTVVALSVGSISSPQAVTATLASQFQLSTPTGSVDSATTPPIGGDTGWYDSGTAVTVRYNNVWNTVAQQSRLAATGYAVDGGSVTSVPESGSGTFQVSLAMNSAHSIDVKSVTQYYTSFTFTDASGKPITPTDLQISVSGKTQEVPGFSAWLDGGSTFTISKLSYEGVDVKPVAFQQYAVSGPTSIGLKGSVYDATVKVTDLLGLAVSGAQVRMTLANGTVVTGTTNGDGLFVAPQVPLGTFSASVSNFGSTAQITGDASKQAVTGASVPLSTASLGLVAVVAVALVGAAVFMLRRRSGTRPPPPPTS